MDELTNLEAIQYLLGTLVVMRICEWIYHCCKLLHDWLSSMFPTSIERR